MRVYSVACLVVYRVCVCLFVCLSVCGAVLAVFMFPFFSHFLSLCHAVSLSEEKYDYAKHLKEATSHLQKVSTMTASDSLPVRCHVNRSQREYDVLIPFVVPEPFIGQNCINCFCCSTLTTSHHSLWYALYAPSHSCHLTIP